MNGPARNPQDSDDRAFLWTCLLLGLAARVAVWWVKGGFHYPDEIFQYLEPANMRLTGLAWMPWEFERGVRSWIPPSFYGALIWWGHQLGLDGFSIHRLLCLHNALWSLLLIPAAYRLGAVFSNRDGARLSALLTALYVPIVFYMPHTLTEVPGLLCTTWGLVHFAEGMGENRFAGRALKAGLLLGLATMVRPTLALWTVVPAALWFFRFRFRSLAAYALAGFGVMALSGLVDWATWGRFGQSTIEYVQYNLVEKGASHHGVNPWSDYLAVWLWERTNIGGVVLLLLALARPKRTWLLLAAAFIPVVALSLIEHKEERFLLSSYPLILTAGAVGWAELVSGRAGRVAVATAATLAGLVLATGLFGTLSHDWRWRAGVFAGQAYVGRQGDATGVLLDDRIHLNGGYLLLGRHIPQEAFNRRRGGHALFNYLVLKTGSPNAAWASRHGFAPVAGFDDMTVFRQRGYCPPLPFGACRPSFLR